MNLLDITPADAKATLESWVRSNRYEAYRVRQILPRLWRRPVANWADTTDLPRELVDGLEDQFPLSRPRLAAKQTSQDETVKFLWQYPDGATVESVFIPEGSRRTLCISSQVGCAYGCTFCATGRMGFKRHLSPWEIVAQVRELSLRGELNPPSHVVFMGMGEPLHNWNAVNTALTILNHESGLGIGARRITVSTIGIIPALLKLAQRDEQFRVAVSLHSPFGDRRGQIMPVEKKYPLADLLKALKRFKKRITFEYVMIGGVNDADDDALELARIARQLGALVNLLPLHPGGSESLTPTSTTAIQSFAERMRGLGATVTVRRSRGLDISAACGQLRSDFLRRSGVETQQNGYVQQ